MKKFTVIFAVCMAVILCAKSMGQAPNTTEAKVYFIDRYMHCLIGITHKIPADSRENQAKSVIEILCRKQSEDSGFITYLNSAKKIDIKVKGETAYLNLPESIAKTAPADRENQKLFIYQIVNTLCSVPDIKYVHLTVDGKNCDDFFSFYKGKEIFSANYNI